MPTQQQNRKKLIGEKNKNFQCNKRMKETIRNKIDKSNTENFYLPVS